MGMCHFILVVCSNSVFILHYFRDINITTFTVYVTVYDSEKSFSILKKSFSFNKTVEIKGTCALRFTSKQNVDNMCYNISQGMGVKSFSHVM